MIFYHLKHEKVYKVATPHTLEHSFRNSQAGTKPKYIL